ncbi:hypothetical protein AA12717_2089 [Gluconacetobacter sacchari DSM 12717]|uniref:Sulfurtransferase TusA family protein n=1 Tax=Gluconacetobacter sacchari DSM 12717 TaxID=1307940 RepID=A0ABQ0P7V0_9PROT|nr:hypothetical protein AA12717_2089 [Gluconacetobacter sacchari DSM 12717]
MTGKLLARDPAIAIDMGQLVCPRRTLDRFRLAKARLRDLEGRRILLGLSDERVKLRIGIDRPPCRE